MNDLDQKIEKNNSSELSKQAKAKDKEQPRFLDILTRSGLNSGEAEIYELLLTNGQMSVQDIMKKTEKFKRTNLYSILYSLRDMGMIEQALRNKKITFRPKDPNSLSRYIFDQKTKYSEAESLLNSVLPGLSELYKLTTEKPVVRSYEGVGGIRKIYEDTLKENKTILAFLTSHESNPKVWRWLRDHYVRKRVDAGIRARVIVSKDKKDLASKEYLEKDKIELRETREVDSEFFPCALEIQVYGNKVSFANYNKNDALVGIIIDNKNIAKSMKGLFELAWRGSKSN